MEEGIGGSLGLNNNRRQCLHDKAGKLDLVISVVDPPLSPDGATRAFLVQRRWKSQNRSMMQKAIMPRWLATSVLQITGFPATSAIEELATMHHHAPSYRKIERI